MEALTGDNIPKQEDIEQMVGLVNAKVVVKTLHEMLKERTKEGAAQEEALARQFVKRMRTETKDREKVKEEAKRRWEALQDKLKFAEVQAKMAEREKQKQKREERQKKLKELEK